MTSASPVQRAGREIACKHFRPDRILRHALTPMLFPQFELLIEGEKDSGDRSHSSNNPGILGVDRLDSRRSEPSYLCSASRADTSGTRVPAPDVGRLAPQSPPAPLVPPGVCAVSTPHFQSMSSSDAALDPSSPVIRRSTVPLRPAVLHAIQREWGTWCTSEQDVVIMHPFAPKLKCTPQNFGY